MLAVCPHAECECASTMLGSDQETEVGGGGGRTVLSACFIVVTASHDVDVCWQSG